MGDSKFGWRYWLVQSLTCSRLLLGWFFVFIMIFSLGHFQTMPKKWFLISLAVLIGATLTDLDGWLARRFKVTTTLGAFLDPLMDKCLYAAVLIPFPVFAYREKDYLHLAVLMILVIVYLQRDHMVTTLRSIGSLQNISAKAHWSGKVRTFFSFPMIWVIHYYFQAPPDYAWLRPPLSVILTIEIIGIFLTFLSILQYTRKYQSAIVLAGAKFE